MSSHSQKTPDELLRDYYRCDEQAFEEFDSGQRARLARLAFLQLPSSLPGRQEEAEDVAADVLIQVANTKGRESRWDPTKGSLRGWLVAFVQNRVITRVRRKRQPPSLATDLPAPAGESASTMENLVVSDDPDPGESAEFQELLAALDECVAGLPPDLRRAVVMEYEEGRPRVEIAQALGVSPATVTRLFDKRIRPLLLKCLQGKGHLKGLTLP